MTTHRSNFTRALAGRTPAPHPLEGMFTPAELDELDALCPILTPAELDDLGA